MKYILNLAAAAFVAVTGFAAAAAEIRVVSSVGMKAVIEEAKPLFERVSGHKLIVVFGTAVPLKRQLEEGEAFDLAILTPPLIADLAEHGRVVPLSVIDVAMAGLGLAIRKGAAKPDISTPDALKRALLDAKSIAHSKEGQSGAAAVRVMEKLGVAEEMKPRVLLETRPGGSVMAVNEGKAELGFALVSEIVPIPEVDYLGPVPESLQTYTIFTAGISVGSRVPDAAKTFVRFLLSEDVAPIRRAKGMERAAMVTLERKPAPK